MFKLMLIKVLLVYFCIRLDTSEVLNHGGGGGALSSLLWPHISAQMAEIPVEPPRNCEFKVSGFALVLVGWFGLVW